jgi:uncharacterized protein (DUF305 family)
MVYRSRITSRRQFSALLAVVVGTGVAAALATTVQAQFAAENRKAMARMMAGMDIKSSGNVDRDFATMMIAHHEGAIAMANAELHYGSNEQLHRIAQEIIVEQRQEIEAMQLALRRSAP